MPQIARGTKRSTPSLPRGGPMSISCGVPSAPARTPPISSARARDHRTRISTRARAPVPTFRRGRSGAVTRASSVSVHDARSLLFGDAAADHVYLDVRTSKEFGEQHAVGAVNVPVADMTPNGPQPLPGFVKKCKAPWRLRGPPDRCQPQLSSRLREATTR